MDEFDVYRETLACLFEGATSPHAAVGDVAKRALGATTELAGDIGDVSTEVPTAL